MKKTHRFGNGDYFRNDERQKAIKHFFSGTLCTFKYVICTVDRTCEGVNELKIQDKKGQGL